MSESYVRQAREADRPKLVADYRAEFERLPELLSMNGVVLGRLEHFATQKHITLDGLAKLGTRIHIGHGGGVELVYGYEAPDGRVTALKFRPLGDGKPYTREPSTYALAKVLGDATSLAWYVAEGETDSVRLSNLIGTDGAVLVLPAGALTFKREWADVIPRGATVYLAHDADEYGDKGATKAASIIGGKTVRLRPPVKDWCEWDGERQEFAALVREAGSDVAEPFALSLDDYIAQEDESPQPLLGDERNAFIPQGGLVILGGGPGIGKTTLILDLSLHLASGLDYLGATVSRPLRILLVENEGPQSMFREKLRHKREHWEHEISGGVYVQRWRWGHFSFADRDAAERAREFVEHEHIDLVIGDPLVLRRAGRRFT